MLPAKDALQILSMERQHLIIRLQNLTLMVEESKPQTSDEFLSVEMFAREIQETCIKLQQLNRLTTKFLGGSVESVLGAGLAEDES